MLPLVPSRFEEIEVIMSSHQRTFYKNIDAGLTISYLNFRFGEINLLGVFTETVDRSPEGVWDPERASNALGTFRALGMDQVCG